MLKITRSSLNGRTFAVKAGITSQSAPATAGVSKDSVLNPLLSLVYINYIPETLTVLASNSVTILTWKWNRVTFIIIAMTNLKWKGIRLQPWRAHFLVVTRVKDYHGRKLGFGFLPTYIQKVKWVSVTFYKERRCHRIARSVRSRRTKVVGLIAVCFEICRNTKIWSIRLGAQQQSCFHNDEETGREIQFLGASPRSIFASNTVQCIKLTQTIYYYFR